MRQERFVIGKRPQVDVSVKSGDILLLAGNPGEVSVELFGSDNAIDATEVVQAGDVVTVRDRSGIGGWLKRGVNVTVTLPPGTRALLRGGSGNATASVVLSHLTAEFASGDVRLDDVTGDVAVDSASGDVAIGSIGGDLSISLASGDLRIGETAGRAVIDSASGDINLGRVSGSLKVRTASGDVTVRSFGGSELIGQSMSGDFRLGLESGLSVDADIQTRSGSIRNETTESAEREGRPAALRIATMSGDIILLSAS